MKNGKAAVFLKPYQFEIRELPTVSVDPDGILVKITSAADLFSSWCSFFPFLHFCFDLSHNTWGTFNRVTLYKLQMLITSIWVYNV